MVQLGHGRGDTPRGRGRRRERSAARDALPGRTGACVLAAGQHEADRSGAAHGRLREQPLELRPAQEQLCSRTNILAPSLLDAAARVQASAGGLQEVRQDESWFPHQRGCAHRHRDPHIVARAHHTRLHHAAARAHPGTLPLRRGRWLCRWHRLGWCRRRALRRDVR